MATNVATLTAKLKADTTDLRRGLGKAEKDVRGFEQTTTKATKQGAKGFDDLQASLANPASGYERVEVRTATPDTLVLDALHVAQAAYETANEERAQVVELMGQGKTREAIGLLARCLERWQQINEMIAKSISFLGMKDQTLGNAADQVAVKLEPVKRQLSQIKEALTSQDFVALADILQYEFEEAGQCWLEVIQSIIDYAETNGKAPAAG